MRRTEQGSVLPAVLALVTGVGALATGYAMRTVREHDRQTFHRATAEGLYATLARLEVAAAMVRAADYDAGGRNLAIAAALARPDRQFVDPDGWPTGVRVREMGAPGSGVYELVAAASPAGAHSRIRAMVQERQSYADFAYFVNSHPLGIAGGASAVYPYADAPEGAIHSNDKLVLYFGDRHFRDAVTAVNGFEYTAGARGPDDPAGANNFFHGAANDHAEPIDGLAAFDVASFRTRADCRLALDGEHDFAKVKLLGKQVYVEHWRASRLELQDVTAEREVWHTETRLVQVPDYGLRLERVRKIRPVYETRQVWTFRMVRVDTQGGGGDATAGGGSEGGAGGVTRYRWIKEWYWKDAQVQVGEQEYFEDQLVRYALGTSHEEAQEVRVTDGREQYTTQEWVPVAEEMVEARTFPADGTIYVRGDVYLEPMRRVDGDPFDRHVLDGRLTIATDGRVHVRDSIVYGTLAGGKLVTAFLNGNDHTEPFERNPAYTGDAMLGVVARGTVLLEADLPDEAEIDATLVSTEAQVAVTGVRVNADGSVTPTLDGRFVKTSLRRLGGTVTNLRPVSSYVNSGNVVTRGFQYGKSVFDRRQLVDPPRGVPTLNRPKLIARIVKEVQ